jgi:FkbM family methyltransferase
MFKKLAPVSLWPDEELVERALYRLERVTYRRLAKAGFAPATVIDIGAYHGAWSLDVHRVFPTAKVLMFEAAASNEPFLKSVAERIGAEYSIALLSGSGGHEKTFYVQETGSSLYSERSNAPKSEARLTTTALDSALAKHAIETPIFLKIDTQGSELDILAGAKNVLSRSEVVQLECALLNYNDGAPDFAAVVSFMNERGFKMFDIASFVRPNGQHLVQIDSIFVKANSRLRADFFKF